MATQQVHNVCYMVDCVLDLSQEISQAAILPKGSTITHLSVEVQEAAQAGGILDLGFEGDTQALANDIDTGTKGVNICNVAFTSHKDESIIATSQNTTSGKAILRVVYFLPSTIRIDY